MGKLFINFFIAGARLIEICMKEGSAGYLWLYVLAPSVIDMEITIAIL